MAASKIQTLELLAPARDAATAIAAIQHGADAVYIGAPAFGARASAGNSIEEIATVTAAARPYGVRVYVTVNTILYDAELQQVAQMIHELWRVGVDALIVQDPALLTMDIPPIELHASTQWDSRSPQKIARLAQAGFAQIVVPREFSLEQIAEAAEAAQGAAIEAFVHGALCVSYSGDCHAGQVLANRSANRGQCPQICRLKYTLADGAGHPLQNLPDGQGAERHWLSLADMNRLDYLQQMAEAGVSSFKIEGRLKPISYVKTVTAAYSKALDELVARYPDRYRRSSYGRTQVNFKADLKAAFNRGFTPYFLTAQADKAITSWSTPKFVGPQVAVVEAVEPRRLRVKASVQLHNGDGLGWFDPQRGFTGFRVNRVDGQWVYPAPGGDVPVRRGTPLYRNSHAEREAMLQRNDTAQRTVAVDFTLRQTADGRLALDVSDERGCRATATTALAFTDQARSPQTVQRRELLGKLGNTHYRLQALDDRLGGLFVPSSALAALRRDALQLLENVWDISRRRPHRRPCQLPADALAGLTTTYHDNLANAAARQFYADHGATVAESAIEVEPQQGRVRVMTTRYCLRRSLGVCLKTPGANRLPKSVLKLLAPIGTLELEFDCKNCQMKIYTSNRFSDK